MEVWQREHIRTNLPELLDLTTCVTALLAYLESKSILSKSDLAELNSIPNSETKTSKLYEILQTRVDSYNDLINGLNITRQSGAHKILFEGLQSHQNGETKENGATEPAMEFVNQVRYMKDFMGDENNRLFVITTFDLKLTKKRIQDTFEEVIFYDSATVNLKTVKDAGGTPAILCKDVANFISKVTTLCNATKVILITQEDKDSASRATKSTSISVITGHDDITWTDLAPSSQEILQQRSVSFQGYATPLRSIVSEESLYRKLKGQIMVNLINNKCPQVVNDSVPPPLNYYINRTLVCRRQVSPDIFDTRSDDVFVFKGIEWSELTKLVKGGSTERSSTQTKELTVRFVWLEYEEDFEKIGQLAKSAHLINYQKGKLEWEKSHGPLSLIQQFILDEQNQDSVKEEIFMDQCLQSEDPVCISDTPGMGKTILLANLARRTMSTHPNRVVRFVVLREFMQEIQQQQQKKHISLEVVSKAIAKQGSENEFGKEMIKCSLASSEVLCELMFDGFDEVLSDQVKLTKELLKFLAKLKKVKIYVTARPHLLHDLEEVLGVLGHNIMPFQEKDQIEFLLKYWEDGGAKRNERLEEFSKSALCALKKNMTNFERDITGIPLQCALLAEVHSENAIKYSTTQNRSTDFGPTISVTSIFEMYQKLMSIRFERISQFGSSYWKRFLAFFAKRNLKEKMEHTHIYAAIQLLFPQYAETFRELLLGKRNFLPVEKLCRIGILEKKNILDDTPRFVHRTFAEYFLGFFVVQMLKQNSELGMRIKSEETRDKCHLFLIDILSLSEKFESPLLHRSFDEWENIESFECQYPVICYFVNSHLKGVAFSSSDISSTARWVTDNDMFRKQFIMSIVNDYQHICQLLVDQFFEEFDDKILQWSDVLLLAAKHSSKPFMAQICKYFKNRNGRRIEDITFPMSSSNNYVLTPLHVSVQRGSYTAVEFLWLKINLQNSRNEQWNRNLLHLCVCESRNDSNGTITEKKQILQLLVTETEQHLLLEKRPGGITPLLEQNIHLGLIDCMIKLGADVNAISHEKNTILTTILTKRVGQVIITAQEFCQVVDILRQNNFSKFDEPDSQNRTPLHLAVENFDLDKETLGVFSQNKVNFNAVDDAGESILFSAVRGKRSQEMLKELIHFGADWRQANSKGQTILHVAVECGHMDAVMYFIEQECDVNQADKDGNTPLHEAMCSRTHDHLLIQKALYQAHANVNALNRQSKTALLHGLQHGKGLSLEMIQCAQDHGMAMADTLASAALTCLLGNGNITILEWDQDMVAVADYFLSMGALVKSKKSNSPWSSEQFRMNFKRLTELTECTPMFFAEMGQRDILTEEDKMDIQSENNNQQVLRLYDILQTRVGSYERFMIAAIAAKQIRPFVIMQQCLQIDNNDAARYVTAPLGLVDFMVTEADRALFLNSINARIALHRIRDTIGQYTRIIPESELTLTNYLLDDDSGLNVVVCSTKKTVDKLMNNLLNHMQCKLVCIIDPYIALGLGPDHLAEAVDTTSICINSDGIRWSDLSSSFQTGLLPCIARLFQRERCASKYLKEPSSTVSGMLLTKLIDKFDHDSATKVANSKAIRSSNATVNLVQVPKTNNVSTYARLVNFIQCMYPNELAFPVNYCSNPPLWIQDELDKKRVTERVAHQLLAKVLWSDLPLETTQILIESECNVILNVLHMPPTGANLKTLISLVNLLKDYYKLAKVWVLSSEQKIIAEMEKCFSQARVQNVEEMLLEREIQGIHNLWNSYVEKGPQNEHAMEYLLKPFETTYASYAMECLSSYKMQNHKELLLLSEGLLNEAFGDIRLYHIFPSYDPTCYCLLYAMRFDSEFGLAQGSGEVDTQFGSMLEKIMNRNVLKYEVEQNFSFYAALLHTAIQQYYPDWQILLNYPMEFQCEPELLLKTGVITLKNDRLAFIHECFANHLISLLLVEKSFAQFVDAERLAQFFKSAALSTEPLFVEQLPKMNLRQFCNPYLAYSINYMCSTRRNTQNEQDSSRTTPLPSDSPWTFTTTLSVDHSQSQNIFKAAAISNFRALLGVIEPTLSNYVTHGSYQEHYEILRLSMTVSNPETIKYMLTCFNGTIAKHPAPSTPEEHTSFPFYTLLANAAARGSYSVVQDLLDSSEFREAYIKPDLLHTCIKNTLNDDVAVIEEKAQIVRKLVKMSTSILLDTTGRDENPSAFHQDNLHLQLIKELVNLGVDIEKADSFGYTLLHRVTEYLCPEEFTELIAFLKETGKTSAFEQSGSCRALLHYAMSRMTLLPSTIQAFKAVGVDLNEEDDEGNSVLVCAIRGNQSEELVHSLIQCEADWRAKDAKYNNMVHVAAVAGNLSALKLLIELGCDANHKNEDGNSPLHSALISNGCGENVFDTVRILVEQGAADVTAVNNSMQTPLHLAVMTGSAKVLNIIEYLIDRGCFVNYGDKEGQTVVHLAPKYLTPQQFHELAQLLVGKNLGYALFAEDDNKLTPIGIAAEALDLLGDTMMLAENVAESMK